MHTQNSISLTNIKFQKQNTIETSILNNVTGFFPYDSAYLCSSPSSDSGPPKFFPWKGIFLISQVAISKASLFSYSCRLPGSSSTMMLSHVRTLSLLYWVWHLEYPWELASSSAWADFLGRISILYHKLSPPITLFTLGTLSPPCS